MRRSPCQALANREWKLTSCARSWTSHVIRTQNNRMECSAEDVSALVARELDGIADVGVREPAIAADMRQGEHPGLGLWLGR